MVWTPNPLRYQLKIVRHGLADEKTTPCVGDVVELHGVCSLQNVGRKDVNVAVLTAPIMTGFLHFGLSWGCNEGTAVGW